MNRGKGEKEVAENRLRERRRAIFTMMDFCIREPAQGYCTSKSRKVYKYQYSGLDYILFQKRCSMADMEEESGDEYELIPRNKIQDLQKQVEALKKSPLAGAPSGNELAQSMNKLSTHLESLLGLFKEASEEMKKEERDSESVVKKLDPLMEKLDMVVEQNKKIAKAILTISDMVRELQEQPSARPAIPLPSGPLPPPPRGGMTYGAMGMPITGPSIPPPPGAGFEDMPLPEPMPSGMRGGFPSMGMGPQPGQGTPEIPPPPGSMGQPKRRGLFGR